MKAEKYMIVSKFNDKNEEATMINNQKQDEKKTNIQIKSQPEPDPLIKSSSLLLTYKEASFLPPRSFRVD